MTIDETIADLRVLRGDPEVVSVDIDVAHALADEVERLRAIIEGRTTPPTTADLAVHAAHGGLWRTRYTLGDPVLAFDCMNADMAERVRDEQTRTGGVYLWWALDSHGRPCAWPGDVP